MKFPYYMLTTIHDTKLPNGVIKIHAKGRILTAEEAKAEGFHDGYSKEAKAGDEWLDGFASLHAAKTALHELQDA